MNETPRKRSEADIREEARQWFVSLLDRPTAERRAGFEKWLQSDSEHYKAYASIEAAWQAAEKPGQRLAEKEADQLSVYLEAMDRSKAQRKTFRRLSGLGVVLALALAGAIWLERPGLIQDMLADYSSGRAERRTIVLSDGSSVLLDADSAFNDDYTGLERRVRLLRGAAFFDVVGSNIPFIVQTRDGEIRVLGTAFSVQLLDDGGVVTLARGSVRVRAEDHSKAVTIEPGQQVRFGRQEVGEAAGINLDDELAWRDGRFVFYRSRLADVVNEIQRYRNGRIVISSPALANERVTGSIPLSDTDAALKSLQASLGFRMNTVAGRLTVIRR